MLSAREKRIRQLAPVRVTEGEEIELMRIAARLDRPVSWVRRAAYRAYILEHGGTVDLEPEHDNVGCALPGDSAIEGMPKC